MGLFSKPKCAYFDCDREAKYTCSVCGVKTCGRHCFPNERREMVCWSCVDSPARRQVLRALDLHPITAEPLDGD